METRTYQLGLIHVGWFKRAMEKAAFEGGPELFSFLHQPGFPFHHFTVKAERHVHDQINDWIRQYNS